MSAPGFGEWVWLGLLALLILGPTKLPEVARTVGKTVAQLRREMTSVVDELKQGTELDEFKGVAADFRQTTADLKRSTQLTGPLASSSGAKPVSPGGPAARSTVTADTAPPFDPDAT